MFPVCLLLFTACLRHPSTSIQLCWWQDGLTANLLSLLLCSLTFQKFSLQTEVSARVLREVRQLHQTFCKLLPKMAALFVALLLPFCSFHSEFREVRHCNGLIKTSLLTCTSLLPAHYRASLSFPLTKSLLIWYAELECQSYRWQLR